MNGTERQQCGSGRQYQYKRKRENINMKRDRTKNCWHCVGKFYLWLTLRDMHSISQGIQYSRALSFGSPKTFHNIAGPRPGLNEFLDLQSRKLIMHAHG